MPASGPGPQCTALFARLGPKGPVAGKVALHAKEEALCQTAVENGPLQTAGGKGANLIKIPRARPLTRFQSTWLMLGKVGADTVTNQETVHPNTTLWSLLTS